MLGNAAGRPLINAVGKPRVVINGTALDYLAESFMAGDPLKGGGFVILNGIAFRTKKVRELPTPYPGSNLFSLASGGAIYVRDPHCKLVDEQLNGGQYVSLTDEDWWLILPYLRENERLFGIPVDELLTVNGVEKSYAEVHRKVQVVKLAVLAGQRKQTPGGAASGGRANRAAAPSVHGVCRVDPRRGRRRRIATLRRCEPSEQTAGLLHGFFYGFVNNYEPIQIGDTFIAGIAASG